MHVLYIHHDVLHFHNYAEIVNNAQQLFTEVTGKIINKSPTGLTSHPGIKNSTSVEQRAFDLFS